MSILAHLHLYYQLFLLFFPESLCVVEQKNMTSLKFSGICCFFKISLRHTRCDIHIYLEGETSYEWLVLPLTSTGKEQDLTGNNCVDTRAIWQKIRISRWPSTPEPHVPCEGPRLLRRRKSS
ncbi:hypothetical protein JRQ81_006489 [Phrynocephalus forsythii]|uniref:Secreted protein n=1 Tax=Phrynocephalus forsythii TaxID=171643 RepID=A0A9Q0XI37_9SAUR|nr:hypothetical protein JRQ81_006489 [Phrynocephalus forsythii]